MGTAELGVSGNSRVLLPADRMPTAKRVVSAVLLACGIILVFAGLSAALGFTALGILASVAAIAALLYAGAVWFGEAPSRRSPPAPKPSSSSIARCAWRPAARRACRSWRSFPSACAPKSKRGAARPSAANIRTSTATHAGARLSFDIAPVQIHGVVLYGVLISGSVVPVAHMAAVPLPADAPRTAGV